MADPSLHVVLVPFMAQGHTIPMLDLAHLLASRGVLATLITTPINAARIKATVDRAASSGLPIRLAVLRFPCAEVGLPEGSENIDLLPALPGAGQKFFQAAALLRRPLEAYLNSHHPPPSSIISDSCHPWTLHVARSLHIPRFTFFSICCFTLLCDRIISPQTTADPNEPFLVAGLNHRIEVTTAQAPGFFAGDEWVDVRNAVKEGDAASDGVVVNSFDEMEPWYVDRYEKVTGKKIWVLGPMLLCNDDAAARGNAAAIDKGRCLSWLDGKEPGSVIYISFGSLTLTPPAQLFEIGLGLEGSGAPFIWVVKEVEISSEVERWLVGFEERVGSRGLVIKGWAPQVMILSHVAVGGFMTHCGWNSSLESIVAGVPMITWPFFADQFLNERLLVDVLGVAVGSGVKEPAVWGVDSGLVLVERSEIEETVKGLMETSEGGEMRGRARELGARARLAMEEGGSSHANMTELIKCIENWN